MKWAPVALVLAFCSLGLPMVRADSGPTIYILQPAADITLFRGEKVELSILDTRSQKAVDPSKITWRIDGQPAANLPISEGSFTPATAPAANAVYRTPLKKPEHDQLALSATIADPAGSPGSTTVAGSITITGERNWFAIDGDTGSGPQNVSIALDPDRPSLAGFGLMPYGLGAADFVVHVLGSRKGPVHGNVIQLELGPNSAPGTYAWRSGQPTIGATIGLGGGSDREYRSIDFGTRDMGSTQGSITILKTRPVDPPGQVKGFFSGRLCWTDESHHFLPHYLTIRGHFAVPGKAAPPAASPATPAP
jgi:hypothetical protein